MDKLKIIESNRELYVDSREVAEMVGKRHADLVRGIENYESVISTNAKLRSLDYFLPSAYEDKKGEMRKRYLLTKKGCDMVANKMTGEKGILFTATYIDAFYNMEQELTQNRNIDTNRDFREHKQVIYTTLETWRKDLVDSVEYLAARTTEDKADENYKKRSLWVDMYKLCSFELGINIQDKFNKMKREFRKENKGVNCTLNKLDFISDNIEYLPTLIKAFNTYSKKENHSVLLSYENEIGTLVTEQDIHVLTLTQESVAMQELIENSGQECPKDYRKSLAEMLENNKPLLEYALKNKLLLN